MLQWIPIDSIVAELESTYNINNTNYVNKLGHWVTQALGLYKVYIKMEAAVVDLEIKDRFVYLPDDIKLIAGVTYKGAQISKGKSKHKSNIVSFNDYMDAYFSTGFQVVVTKDEQGKIISTYKTDISVPFNNVQYIGRFYFTDKNQIMSFNFGEDGETVRLYYLRLPHSYDAITGAYLPMVPDDAAVIENITWYVLRALLYSGYSHPILNLGHAMPYMNPAKMYESTFAKARTAFLKWSPDDRRRVNNLMTSLIMSYRDSELPGNEH